MKIEDLMGGDGGDDVVTIVGRGEVEAASGQMLSYAAFVVDYAECKEGLAQIYTNVFAETWNSDSWARGVKLRRMSPTSVHAETVARTAMLGFEDGEQHHHEGPQFWITAENANVKSVDEFFEMARGTNFWMLSLQTIDACYSYVFSYPDGALIDRNKRPRIEIKTMREGKEGA